MSAFVFDDRTDIEAVCRAELPPDIKNAEALLAALALALHFPDYFGQNWNALDECIRDLSWLPPGDVALVHSDIPLADDRASLLIYLSILRDAMENWVTKGSNLIYVSSRKYDATGERASLAKRELYVVFPESEEAIVRCVLTQNDSTS